MPVQASCEHCGFTYVAKDDMAGKKVRCRNCGQVFTIALADTAQPTAGADALPNPAFDPSAAGSSAQADMESPSLENLPNVPSPPSPYERNSNVTRVMPAIHTTESNMTGGIGSAKSMMQRTGDPGMFDVAGGIDATTGRRVPKPFDFPFARELDRFAPKVVLWLMLIWVAYVAFAWNPADPSVIPEPYPVMTPPANPYPSWAGAIPAGVMVLLFAILWLPLFALGMNRLSAVLRIQLPNDNKSRAAALAVFPFALGAVLWLTGWSTGSLVSGVVLGIAIATPAAWFLYRLQEKEIPYAGICLAASGLVATGLSIALYVSANALVNQTLVASGHGDLFDVSPMGPHLNWSEPKRAKPPAGATAGKTPTPEKSGGGNNGAPPVPGDVVPKQGLLRDVKVYAFDRDPARFLPIPARNDMVGIISQTGSSTEQEVARYMLDAKTTSRFDITAAPLLSGDACISPDGDHMAIVGRSAGNIFAVKVWSFKANKLETRPYSPPEWQATDTIIMLGFISDSEIVCARRQRGTFQPLTLDLRSGVARPWYAPTGPRSPEDKSSDLHSQLFTASADLKHIALTAITQDGKAWLRVYSSDGTVADSDLRDMDRTVALNPTGISFSPDGTQVAASFEGPGAMFIRTCPATGRDAATPAFDGNASFTLGIKASDAGDMGPRGNRDMNPRDPRDRDFGPGGGPGGGPGSPRGGGNMGFRDTSGPPPQNQLVWLAGGDRWLYGMMVIDGLRTQKQGTIELGQQVKQLYITEGEKLMALVGTDRGNMLVCATIATSPAPAGTAESATTRP